MGPLFYLRYDDDDDDDVDDGRQGDIQLSVTPRHSLEGEGGEILLILPSVHI